MKEWYESKTIWLLIGQLFIIWGSYLTGETSLRTVLALSLTTAGGMIVRYYTQFPMKSIINNNKRK